MPLDRPVETVDFLAAHFWFLPPRVFFFFARPLPLMVPRRVASTFFSQLGRLAQTCHLAGMCSRIKVPSKGSVHPLLLAGIIHPGCCGYDCGKVVFL